MKHFSKKNMLLIVIILTTILTSLVFYFKSVPIYLKHNTGQYAVSVNPDNVKDTIIYITPSDELGKIIPDLYGANQRFNSHGNGMWNPKTAASYENFNQAFDDVSFKSLRYPGGTVANLFNWKQSIGPLEQRQKVYSEIDDAPTEIDFGLDEAARFCEVHNSTMVYMYGAGSGNAKDAADLIEYLNSPNNGSNPNCGTDWAAVRAANGHPEPYNIKYFEIGNEMYNEEQRYWLDGASDNSYIYNYAFGGTVSFTRQLAAAQDDYSIAAGKSSGKPNQVKYAKYPPVNQGSDEVYIGNTKWTRVDDLSKYGNENVYTIDNVIGKLCFGDGVHGNIPEKDKSIEITYSSTHDGFNQYYEAMKSVDPAIKIFSCMNESEFFDLMGEKYMYDGVSLHSYVSLPFITQKYVNLKLKPGSTLVEELHDRLMFVTVEKKKLAEDVVKEMRSKVGQSRADKVNVIITEYGILNKGEDPVKNYRQSLDVGLYNAKLLMNWIDLGIPVAQKHCLIGGDGGMIGPAPDFVETPTALMLKVFINMLGDTRISSSISNNPIMRVNVKDTLGKLQVTASKDKDGNVYIIAVNCDRKDDVSAAIELSGSKDFKSVDIWTLNGESYTTFNTAQQPDNVSIKENKLLLHPGSFNYTFPAHSITALKLVKASKK